MSKKSIQERLYWSIKVHGIVGTSLTIFSELLKKIRIPLGNSKWYYQFLDRCFDRRANTETSQYVQIQDLHVADELKSGINEYSPSPAVVICMALNRLESKGFSFVDIGCGKGKVLVLASMFPSRSVLGIELCPRLSQTATANITNNKSINQFPGEVTVLNHDATNCPLPQNDLLIYLFNSFGTEVLQEALANIEKSLCLNPRKAFLLYSNPVHREVLDQSDVWHQRNDLLPGFDNWCAL